MWIDRAIASRILTLARHYPAVALTGARQTGKSALLRRLFPQASYVPLDLPSLASAAEESSAAFLASYKEPILLDEVQYAPGLFRHLKYWIDQDRHKTGRLLLTGSQKFPLMKSLSDSLAGRVAIVELDSLSSAEISDAAGRLSTAGVIWRGGYPELYRNIEMDPREFYANYTATYLERDVRFAMQVASLRDFERFLRACAARSAQLLNLTELARDVGVSQRTAHDWLGVLERSNQVFLLEPYFTSLSKRLVKTPKLYFRDTGLLCFLLGLDSPRDLMNSNLTGAVWETFVLGQILRARNIAQSAGSVHGWRDSYGAEVDFVIEHNGRIRLIEAKWIEHPADEKPFRTLRKVATLFGKRAADEHWVACRTPHPYPLPGEPKLRAVNGQHFDGWFAAAGGRRGARRAKW